MTLYADNPSSSPRGEELPGPLLAEMQAALARNSNPPRRTATRPNLAGAAETPEPIPGVC